MTALAPTPVDGHSHSASLSAPDRPGDTARGGDHGDGAAGREEKPHGKMLHPVVMMLWVLIMAVAMTWWVDAGRFERAGKLVVPGTYQVVPKTHDVGMLVAPKATHSTPEQAQPANVVSAFLSVPQGLVKNAPLIFMVMFVGGMFGVMRKTGAIDAGIDRLLQLTSGNMYVLAPLLMVLIALGSTLLGFISEYLVVIPMVMVLTRRLGLSNLFAVALVAIAAKIGYIASVTNPLALAVAQPLVGLPLFSGLGLRVAIFVVFLALGIAYFLWHVYRSDYRLAEARAHMQEVAHLHARLSTRHKATLLVLAVAAAMLVYGTRELKWGNLELSAFYVLTSLVTAVVGRLDSRTAADAFVEGLKGMMLAGLLIGLAASVEIILHGSYVLDTLINDFTQMVRGQSAVAVANGLMGVQMALDVFIPSVSGKAAVSMPIIGPIAQLSGVSPQTSVLAFLLGGGLTNMITPTSGMLLAYLATARVGFGQWLKFILPLFFVLLILSGGALAFAVLSGY
ncbi:C4-dicarboxylate ABC transporter [Pandoraea iniqua]|uniref:C4-dicarboxylate ABC transporter n=1 Tax=Pandoraea iniqua TaxID=2508288 RepID=A0A5E4THV9_9BURK|nr:SLC13 family permease [Pandoraea iniqua]VVD87425.1 C4-dicarboxylate ABC transporter [Pandoraea iniqua]